MHSSGIELCMQAHKVFLFFHEVENKDFSIQFLETQNIFDDVVLLLAFILKQFLPLPESSQNGSFKY